MMPGFKGFFSGCYVLEYLYLCDCVLDTINVFEVSVPSLKCLRMYDINDLFEFRLNAPTLEYLRCKSYAAAGYFGTFSSLMTAYIAIELKDEQFGEEKISGLVNIVSQTRSLTLECDSMQALVYSDYSLPLFHNLTELRVSASRAVGWVLLPDLLDNSPYLEVLTFSQGFYEDDGSFVEPTSFLPEWIPTCISSRLKEVKFGSFQGLEGEIKMVEYFLKNAKVLEKVTISPSPEFGSDLRESRYLNMKEQFPMTKRLLTLPRSSRACRVIFTDGFELVL